MMSKTFGLLFYIRRAKNKTDEAAIFLRITVDQMRTEISTKRYCDSTRWNSSMGRLKGNLEDARRLNSYLDAIQAKIYDIHQQLVRGNEPITPESIKNAFIGVAEKPKMLLEVFAEHNLQMQQLIKVGDYSSGTYKHFKTTYHHLRDFLPWKFRKKDIDVRKVTFQFIADFEYYMKVEKKLGHNSCMKYLGDFKKILLQCVRNTWIPNNPFTGYMLVRREVVANYLLMEEINAIAKLELPAANLALVRDVFLFSCYTGLAYADVKKLTYAEIQPGLDGYTWLFIQRQKTGTPAPVPLLPICFEILEKYKDHPKCRDTNLVFPVYSNQKMNMYLKDIANLAGIQKFVTYHLARHSFATSVTLNNDVPIESVSRMMGHKTLKQTQHYAKVLNRKVSDDMQVLRQKMNKSVSPEPVYSVTSGQIMFQSS